MVRPGRFGGPGALSLPRGPRSDTRESLLLRERYAGPTPEAVPPTLPMTSPEEWKRVRVAFERALELSNAERPAFLSELQQSDPALAASVLALLERDGEEAVDDAPRLPAWEEMLASTTLPEGTRLGAYEIRGEIASGGMGTVYRAERADDEFDKSVAIKLIKRGMDSAVILKRFRYERQVLADLEHPGIARLLDGGMSADGQPYFVMEYVDGEPIDEWCDSHKTPLRARLELFQRVCQGVHHAHQRLVVHRDLKPSNILVTRDGEPKLLDFGVARMLDPEESVDASVWTSEQSFLGTPSFASPEQLRGERVTTATDVYSLGVVLYRLLTGLRPYELSRLGGDEVRRLVCEVEPTRPSRRLSEARASENPIVPGHLTGDLDNIVLMALRKEPDRRYASAEQLAEDIQRHLDGLPVIARANTLSYRAAKFFRRNRASSLIGAALLLILVTATIVTANLYFDATQANEEADERFETMRRMASDFIFDVSRDFDPLEGSIGARERVVQSALEHLDGMAAEAREDPGVAVDLANAYLRLGDLQGGALTSNLGKRAEARASFEKGRDLALKLMERDPESPRYRVLLACALYRMGDLDKLRGERLSAMAKFEEALSLCPADAGIPQVARTRADVLSRIGESLLKQGGARRALPHLEEAVAIQEELLELDGESTPLRRDMAVSYHQLSTARLFLDAKEDALALCEEACGQLEDLMEREPGDAELRQLNVAFQIGLGRVFFQLARYEEALDPLFYAADFAREILDTEPNNELVLRNLGVSLQVLGTVLIRLERPEEALEFLREAESVSMELMEIDPDSLEHRRSRATNLSTIAGTQTKLGRLQASYENNELARSEFEWILERDPTRPEAKRDLASCYTNLGGYHMSAAKDAKRSAAEQMEHAQRAEADFQVALDRLIELRSVKQLAPVDLEYVGMLERFVGDARTLQEEIRASQVGGVE